MEKFLDKNEHLIDLEKITAIPEIIFELSSILDNPEAKNKRICLKIGNVNLNQAQLMSIKSLINGIGSSLSSIDTVSSETQKTALSLGIIVSNVLPENASEKEPVRAYKTAEELKSLNADKKPAAETAEDDSASEIKEEAEVQEQPKEEEKEAEAAEKEETPETESDIKEETEPDAGITEESSGAIQQISGADETKNEAAPQEEKLKEGVKDDLDVIFSGNTDTAEIFNGSSEKAPAESEEYTHSIVPEQEYTKEDIEIETFPSKYIKQTIRSGQVVSFEGNIFIIGDCHPGSEITASGDITVWGVLSGIAHAGAAGNKKARIRALKMNALQLRIADCYSRRPDSLNKVYIEKTNSFTPEEARIISSEIVVFKVND